MRRLIQEIILAHYNPNAQSHCLKTSQMEQWNGFRFQCNVAAWSVMASRALVESLLLVLQGNAAGHKRHRRKLSKGGQTEGCARAVSGMIEGLARRASETMSRHRARAHCSVGSVEAEGSSATTDPVVP